ncbi:MAG: TraB/GumN family protein [Burkholderiales bacterium]
MKKLAALFVFYFLALASGASADVAAPYSSGLLWKVEKDGVRPSYIFGTIHLSDERVTQMPEKVKLALSETKSFTMELVVDEMVRQVFLEAMFLPVSQDLQGLIGSELYDKTARLMQQNGIPPEATKKLKPWAVLLNLTIPSAKPGVTLDNELLHAARLQHKAVYQLEDVGEQVSVFDDIPMDTQIALLEYAVGHYAAAPDAVEKLVAAYLRQDLGAIWNINADFMREGRETPAYNDYFIKRVIYGRSIVMAYRMQAPLRRGEAFFAVGAMHLFGEQGVLNLLEQEGYKLTPVY